MNASDVIGWIVDSAYYCPDCTPSTREDKATPVFGNSETDSFSHCATCEELIPEVLTSDGRESVVKIARDFLLRRAGRVDIQRQWSAIVDPGAFPDDLDYATIALWREALQEANVKATKLNVCRKVRDILLKAEPCEECTNAECGAIRDAIKEIES